jgi:hypothetical protein
VWSLEEVNYGSAQFRRQARDSSFHRPEHGKSDPPPMSFVQGFLPLPVYVGKAAKKRVL